MHSYQHYVKQPEKKKNLVFIAAVLIGKKVKIDETESHRRHKNSCTCGERSGILKDF